MIKKNYSELFEFTSAQLARLKKEYEPLKGKRLGMNQINKMNTMLSKYSTDMLMKLANADIPFLATAAKSIAVMKRGKKWSDFKTKLDMSEADELQQEACWVGYKQVGMKKKGDRQVPNCVKEDLQEADLTKSQTKKAHDMADELPKKDFIKRYGKDGDAVRYATATNMVKKKLGIEDVKEELGVLGEASKFLRYSDLLIQKGRMQAKGDKQGERLTDIEIKKELKKLGIKESNNLSLSGAFTNAQLSRMKADWAKKPLSALTKSVQDYAKKLDNPTKAAIIAYKINHLADYLDKTFDENKQSKGEETMNESYKDKFNATMKDFGINSLDDLKSDEEKKKFFKAVDKSHDAKNEVNEELTPAQKKLPAGLQKAIAKKQGDKEEGAMKRGSNLDTYKPKPKSEEVKEMGTMNAQYEMMKKEMMKKMEMLKAEKDPKKMEMMKKEMMKEMGSMPEMMKKEMMKKMEMAMAEGFASDAQRKAAFASGYKEKGKDKKEMMKKKEEDNIEEKHEPGHNEMAMNAMKMNAMKMPIKATYGKMNAMKTGDDDMTPMNNMKLNAMIKDPHKSKEDNPKKDMNAGYMKSDVRADVKNGGGADMAKVKDAPKMQTAMKKINAMYKTEKYHDTKPGSIQDVVAQMYQTEDKVVTVEDKKLDDMIKQYMSKGGTITKLPPALQKGSKPSDMKKHQVGAKGVVKSMKMKEVREFISTYNSHFLTNFKAEEFILKD